MPTMIDGRQQVVTGVVPPQQGEALIRETWPSVSSTPFAGLGEKLQRSIVLAPLGWLLLAPFYFRKVFPLLGLATRYAVSNRRVMIRRGFPPRPADEVPLAEIDDIRVRPGSESAFYRAADLEIVSKGQVRLVLPGVSNPEAFRQTVKLAIQAFVAPPAAAPAPAPAPAPVAATPAAPTPAAAT